MTGPDCSRAGRWVGGCRFEARYDTSMVDIGISSFFREARLESVAGTDKLQVVAEPHPEKTYVRDVCVRCGRTIERSDPAEAKKEDAA